MKTHYSSYIQFVLKIVFIFGTFLVSNLSFSQVDEDVNDSVKGYNTGSIAIDNPNSIVEAYAYDPVTDRYVLTKTFEGFNINYPIILTPKEYQDLVLKESMRDYFKKKSDAMDGRKEGSEANKKDLLPKYYVKSSIFESIFGGNTIDVKPTGSVEVDLGGRYTKQDNPSFSPRNRATTTFDFDQRISMSLIGKVGTRLNVNANYDTESTFAFQNLIKLEYAPTEDDIIQKIEVGNVSMPLNSSLIRGAQSLFGVKAQLQFGKTTVTGVFSEQKSQTKSVTSQGGGTITDFELFAQEYDADRHFFFSQYFKNKYDFSLRNYPLIDSRVQITRVEVWITNKQNRINVANNNLRNIIALQDLGEAQLTGSTDAEVVANQSPLATFFNQPIDSPTDNENNDYDPALIPTNSGLLNQQIREIVTSNAGFNNAIPVSEGTDYAKLENARKLTANEYTFHPQLGYVSLQQRLTNDEVLAVAYQYTIGDNVYQVGEFGTDGVDATQVDPNGIPSSQALILKMLKSSLTNVQKPIWGLMMKNIYQIPGAYQLQQEDFKFNILYTDPSPLNYITQADVATPLPANVENTPLLKVFDIDKLNYNNDPQNGGDGFFDFIPGLTVNQQYGRLIFTKIEPFGEHLFEKLRNTPAQNYDGDENSIIDYNANQKKYVFRSLYKSTQAAALQDSEKNKFQLRGKYKSTGGEGIPIGAFNVPKGSVVVSAGGRILVEGVDYTVNYQAGRVQILDPALSASNTPIEVSVENNSVFGQQTRRFFGVNVEHKFSEKFVVNATLLKLTERPFTQKSNYGQESVNNTIFGANLNYSTELPFLTRLVNKLPNLDTDVPSNISFRGEVAFLKPNSPKADQFNGEPTIYVDDFEGSQTTIDLRSSFSWTLAATPERNAASPYLDFGGNANDLSYGFKRAKMAWYTIDPIFYTQRPTGISEEELSFNSTRRIFSQELYPVTDIAVGQSQVINTLDLSYFPTERGPYNFNPAATNNTLPDPTNNFGGIVRSLNSTNFEQGNVEYVQFWMLDPYFNGTATPETATSNTGKVYFNLGEVSEDVLKDGRKFYENGVGTDQIVVQPQGIWGDVPASQSLIYAFDTNEGNRISQDVGYNGLNNTQEAAKFPAFSGLQDPAGDDYNYYLNAQGNLFDRYKNYNGLEGNSPIQVTDTNRGSTTVPDVEDINRDNTMNTINAYYEYSVDVKPNMNVGTDRYVTDVRETQVTLPSGGTINARWLQFKIPISQPENTIGSISDFRSIRFMRLFMTGFNDQVTLRFGALDLVRGEWRRYAKTLDPVDTNVDDDNTNFDVFALNIQENGSRTPIPYVTPPGVQREQLYNNNTLINQNEQSLGLRVSGNGNDGLEPADSRAVFKNISVDMRQFKKLKMFLHAEALPDEPNSIEDDEMVGFIRFGNDFTENFYQVEIPLKKSLFTARSPEEIWPEANEIDLSLSLLTQLKILALNQVLAPGEIYYKNEEELDPSLAGKVNKLRLGIRGNPNFGLIRTLMIGLKNQTDVLATVQHPLNPRDIKGEAWFNELRLAQMDNKGGMAAVANLDGNFADFATISATGKMSTIGFGTLEQGPNERSREDIQQYNIVTNMSLGKLLPKKWGINLPFNYAVGEEFITPKYDPFNQDIELDQLIEVTADETQKRNLKNRAIDYTKRKSINFIGVKKERGEKQKQHFYDPENVTLSYSYNQVDRHNYEIENFIDQQVSTTADYTFAFQSKPLEPFKKIKALKSNYWKLLSDFNFNYLPSNVSFSSNITRQFNKQQFRLVDVEGIGLGELYQRNFLFNYQYGFNYNLTKNLKINFNAASNNLVRNYLDENNNPDNSYTIWTDYWNPGTANQHNQQITVNYELPLNKLPFLSFIKSTYTYTGDSSWQRSSIALSSITGADGFTYNLGNSIQNSGAHRLNTAFNMDSFYKYIGLTKNKKTKKTVTNAVPPKPGQKINSPTPQVAQDSNVFLDGLIGVLTSVKNIQINYTENRGTALPGFLPGVGFFGSSKPSLGFAFGGQDEVRFEAAKRGWLTNYPEFNQSFTQVTARTLDMTANIDLFPDFKVDLTANRTYANNFSEQFDVDANGNYTSRSPNNTGNFAISTVLIKTAFSASDEFGSAAFEEFRTNRLVVANRLAEKYYGANPFTLDAEGYPQGFGKNNQAVLLPAFLAAYSGQNSSDVSLGIFRNIPIPNWNIKYNGLMRYKFFKDKFKRFSIQHNYKASYTINSFRSNFDYNQNPNGRDAGGNLYNKTIVGNVNLVEQFSPLVRVDFETKSSFKILAEMKRDRALSLSFDNNLLTEVKGVEYIIGTGYRFKNVIFSTKLSDDPSGIIKGDINLKVDFSYRNNKTIIRYLDYNNNQIGGGQNIWSAKLTADYSFSKNLTTIFFYDHSFSKAVISTSFPLTNIRAGFTLRYNFGN